MEGAEAYRAGRKTIVRVIDKWLAELMNMEPFEYLEDGQMSDLCLRLLEKLSARTEDSAHSSVEGPVIILDDVMYYRSMRYPYYQLARHYGMGFLQIYVSCETEVAIIRNAGRSEEAFIDPGIIGRMAERLEVPDPAVVGWEANSLLATSPGPWDAQWISDVCSRICSATRQPVEPLARTVDPNEVERTRLANIRSSVHQADLILRTLISDRMKNSGRLGKLSGEQRKLQAEELSNKKAEILSKIRSGDLIFQNETSSDLSICLDALLNGHA